MPCQLLEGEAAQSLYSFQIDREYPTLVKFELRKKKISSPTPSKLSMGVSLDKRRCLWIFIWPGMGLETGLRMRLGMGLGMEVGYGKGGCGTFFEQLYVEPHTYI